MDLIFSRSDVRNSANEEIFRLLELRQQNFDNENIETKGSPVILKSRKKRKKRKHKKDKKKEKKNKSKKKDKKKKKQNVDILVNALAANEHVRHERDLLRNIVGFKNEKIEKLEKKNQTLENLVENLQNDLRKQNQELAKRGTELLNFKYQNIRKEQKPKEILIPPVRFNNDDYKDYKEGTTNLRPEKANVEKDQILLKVMYLSLNDLQSIYFPLSIPSTELFQKLFLSFDLCLDEDEFDTFELVFSNGVSLGYNEEDSLDFVFRKYFPNENITVSGSEVVFEAELKEIPLL